MNDNETSIEISNAGLSLITSYFPILFHKLGYLNADRMDFKSLECKIRAVFAFQYISGVVDKQSSFERILVNLPSDVSLPSSMELTEEEKQMCDNLLQSVLSNWEKMRNASVKAFQESFLMRRGVLKIQELKYLIKPEGRAFDTLLDSLPWGFHIIRFPWMDKAIFVEWR